jgi:hypothetical protein
VRSGNANRCLGVSAIFHSKRLNNDGQRSASSRLLSAEQRLLAVKTESIAAESIERCKIFRRANPSYI